VSALLRSAIEARGGHVFKTVGDAFAAPLSALAAAVGAQPGRGAAELAGES